MEVWGRVELSAILLDMEEEGRRSWCLLSLEATMHHAVQRSPTSCTLMNERRKGRGGQVCHSTDGRRYGEKIRNTGIRADVQVRARNTHAVRGRDRWAIGESGEGVRW